MQERLQWLGQQAAEWLETLQALGIALWTEHRTVLLQIAAIVVLLWLLIKIGKKVVRKYKNRNQNVFTKKERILTRNELRFFKALQQVVAGRDYCIFPMLRVSELLRVQKQSSRKKYYKYLNQISRKHIDFTLCDADTNEIICCIELQDRVRNKESRQKRDQFISELFAKTGIALLRIKSTAEGYDTDILWEQIEEAIEKNEAYLEKIREERAAREKLQREKKRKKNRKRRKKPAAGKKPMEKEQQKGSVPPEAADAQPTQTTAAEKEAALSEPTADETSSLSVDTESRQEAPAEAEAKKEETAL